MLQIIAFVLSKTIMTEPRIVSNKAIMMGKPVIEGTRLTVEFILEELADGRSEQEMLEAYPTLTLEGIRAALNYAIGALKSEQVYPLHFVE